MMRRASFALFLLLCAGPLQAQDALGWNSERALNLITRARERRELPRGDSTLQNYQARANGYVYFYLDRREGGERTLVKVDQVALDLFWKRPNLTKQRIVGLRDVSRLPNRMYYHLDHLTVVQNNLGDVIRIGDGDEVRDVPHPAAPGSDSIYDFRLADSVTLQLGGGQPEVRVYQINVRPKRTNRPAFVGSVYVDRASADIVRMTFTFTPVSYVDRRLDYINISLDNGLFGGSYWLPNEQSVEIRRQLPELDFAAGAVIKGRLRIGNYAFNETLSDSVFYGRPVSAVPEAQRKNFEFPDSIYAGVVEEGLAPPPQMADLRAQAAALLREQRLSGLPPLRLYIPNASSVLRHNFAEGWYAGLGATYAPSTTFRIDATGGYAFAAKIPEATAALRLEGANTEFRLRGYYNEPRDIGPVQGMPGVINTFASWLGDRDYTDLYFTRGVEARHTGLASPRTQPYALLRYERHEAANVGYRTYGGVTEGKAFYGAVGVRRLQGARAASAFEGSAEAGVVRFNEGDDNDVLTFVRAVGEARIQRSTTDLRNTATLYFNGGVEPVDVPGQFRFLAGGVETLPGYRYRDLSGSRFATARIELARTVWGPWVRGRLLGAAGYMGGRVGTEDDIAGVDLEDKTRFSYGAGVGLLWDAIRVDANHGDAWRVTVGINRQFWDLL